MAAWSILTVPSNWPTSAACVSTCCWAMNSCATQVAIAHEVELRVLELRRVARQLPFGLRQLHLERPRIDFRQQVALVHELPFLKRHLDQLPVDAAPHRHRVEGGHRAEPGQVHRHVALPHRRPPRRERAVRPTSWPRWLRGAAVVARVSQPIGGARRRWRAAATSGASDARWPTGAVAAADAGSGAPRLSSAGAD